MGAKTNNSENFFIFLKKTNRSNACNFLAAYLKLGHVAVNQKQLQFVGDGIQKKLLNKQTIQ